jgi:hypothetical protein
MSAKGWHFVVFGTLLVLPLWVALPSPAQFHSVGVPHYNSATEVTLRGSVKAVNQVDGREGWGGTHLRLNTEREIIDVYVGPTWFLTQNKIVFETGDQVQVAGSRVKFVGRKAVLIAREIEKDDTALILRDEHGAPIWSGVHQGNAF